MSDDGVAAILRRLDDMERSQKQDLVEMAERMAALEQRVAVIPEIFEKCKSHCLVGNEDQLRTVMIKALRDTGSNLAAISG